MEIYIINYPELLKMRSEKDGRGLEVSFGLGDDAINQNNAIAIEKELQGGITWRLHYFEKLQDWQDFKRRFGWN